MGQGYHKIGRRRSSAALQWILLGFLPGILCGAFLIILMMFTGVLSELTAQAAPTQVITQVVAVEQIVTATPDANAAAAEPLVVTATPEPTLAFTATPSMTPLPSDTPPPSQTPLPSATPVFDVAGTTQDEINIRYGPGTDYDRVGIAQAGERFEITAYHTQFDWVQVRYPDSPTGFAWIAESLLTIEGDIFTTQAISSTIFNLPTLTPTPSVIQSSPGLSGDTVPLSPEFASLGSQLWNQVLELGFDPQTSRFASLFVLDLQTGEAITFGNDIAYRGTSVNKISILTRLYGTLNAPPPQNLAVDIANTMICSENAATNHLLSAIGEGDEWRGAQHVTDFMQSLGLDTSFLLAPYTVVPTDPPVPPAPIPVPETKANQTVANPEPYNQITVEDMGWLLASMYQCGYQERGPFIENLSGYESRECRQMIHVMASNTVDGLLKAGVPADTRVAHKHGWVNDTHSNAGIFFTPGGDFVIAMAFHSTQVDAEGNRFLSFANTLPAFAETARSVYNYYNPANPMLAIREGFIPDAPTCNFAGTPLIADLQQPVWDR